MKIFNETKELVKIEKKYTTKVLSNLMVIEKDKLYADLKYPSLHKYIVKELKYSDAEAAVRVNAVRLMLKSKKAKKQIESGKINLTNASELQKASRQIKNKSLIDQLVDKAADNSTREFKKIIDLKLERERKEILTLDKHMLEKFDNLRKVYGDLSTYELIQILLEKELKVPVARRRGRAKVKSSRYISKQVKIAVHTGECVNCGSKHSLEYDHIKKYSHGGSNDAGNIQMLCRSCNHRKEIKARQLNFFA